MEFSGQILALAAPRPGKKPGTHSIGVGVAYIEGLDDFENRPLSCTW